VYTCIQYDSQVVTATISQLGYSQKICYRFEGYIVSDIKMILTIAILSELGIFVTDIVLVEAVSLLDVFL
jgi:hypothetical protein